MARGAAARAVVTVLAHAASSTAQWVSAGATTLGAFTALGIATFGRRGAKADRELAERRAAALKVVAWVARAQELGALYAAVPTTDPQAGRDAKAHGDKLMSATAHVLLLVGPGHPLHEKINAVGFAYMVLIVWTENGGGARGSHEELEWRGATDLLYDDLAKLCGYKTAPWVGAVSGRPPTQPGRCLARAHV